MYLQKKIAVCDDSREDRGELRKLLEACGYDFEIKEYGSGEELYADMGYVRECGIVFLDINMEGMDGLEAAEIDGAGVLTVFWKIVLPLAKPILATVAIFAAVGQWNSFQDTLIYITDQKLYSLQYLLYTYINQASSLAAMVRSSGTAAISAASLATQQTPTSIRMTVSVIVVLPILFVYPIFQRFFVKGIMIGSVKG